MIAVEKNLACEYVAGTVLEWKCGSFRIDGREYGIVRDLPQRQKHAKPGQSRNLGSEELIAGRDFFRQRPVLRGYAAHRVTYHRIPQAQPVVRRLSVLARCE